MLAVTGAGRAAPPLGEVLDTVAGRGADVLTVGSAPPTASPGPSIPVPALPEEIAPVLEVLPVQRLALELALARGVDPDRPRGLRKVTRTR